LKTVSEIRALSEHSKNIVNPDDITTIDKEGFIANFFEKYNDFKNKYGMVSFNISHDAEDNKTYTVKWKFRF
jgi:hypothetical protein